MEHIEHVSDAEVGALAVRVSDALASVRGRIERTCAQVGRRPEEITVLAVTKGFGPEAIVSAIRAGLADIGENYYQEAAAKFAAVAWARHPARTHFLGPVQRNKARRIAALFDVVQSVGSAAVAEALERGAADADKTLDVCVQVNVASDERAGVEPDASLQLARDIARCEHLRLHGVMAIGPTDAPSIPGAFALARAASRQIAGVFPDARMLSLGMSHDLEAAVEAGSTMLRLGTALFGPRPNAEETIC